MQQTGEDGLAAARAAADLVGGFQDGHRNALGGQADSGGEPVGPAPHHHCGTHASARRSDQLTLVGIGPLGSQGCSATASATFQVPRSITPSAASISW